MFFLFCDVRTWLPLEWLYSPLIRVSNLNDWLYSFIILEQKIELNFSDIQVMYVYERTQIGESVCVLVGQCARICIRKEDFVVNEIFDLTVINYYRELVTKFAV